MFVLMWVPTMFIMYVCARIVFILTIVFLVFYLLLHVIAIKWEQGGIKDTPSYKNRKQIKAYNKAIAKHERYMRKHTPQVRSPYE